MQTVVAEGFKGKTIPQIHVNEHLLDISFFLALGRHRRRENILVTAIFNLFPSERPLASTFDTRDRELVQHNHVLYA